MGYILMSANIRTDDARKDSRFRGRLSVRQLKRPGIRAQNVYLWSWISG